LEVLGRVGGLARQVERSTSNIQRKRSIPHLDVLHLVEPFANKISRVNIDFTQTGRVLAANLLPLGRHIGKVFRFDPSRFAAGW